MHRYIQWCSDTFSFYKRQEDAIHITGLVLISMLVFFNSLNSYFLPVDDLTIPVHRLPDSFLDIFIHNTFGGKGRGNYRPLEVLPHILDTYLYGHNSPFGRHLTNLIIHICNVILVNRIAFYLTGIKVIGFMAGLLFSVNPVHAQLLSPVGWISGRSDSVVTLFYLITMLLLIKFVLTRSYKLYCMSIVTCLLALLSKEMAITLPFVILVYMVMFPSLFSQEENKTFGGKYLSLAWKSGILGGIIVLIVGFTFTPTVVANYFSPDGVLEQTTINKIHMVRLATILASVVIIMSAVSLMALQRPSKALITLRYSLPYFVVLWVYFIARTAVIGGVGGAYASSNKNQIFAWGVDTFSRDILSLGGLVWPVSPDFNLTVFSWQIENAPVFYASSLIAAIALGIIFLYCIRTSMTITFAYVWIFITMAPVHNILIPSWQFQGRYLYLPAVGFSIFISVLLYKFGHLSEYPSHLRKILVVACIMAVLILDSLFIIERNEKISSKGEIKEFVASIKTHQSDISGNANLNFIIFPLSAIDTLNNVYETAYMQDVLNFADDEPDYKKRYRYEFLLFVPGEDHGQVHITWENEKVFIIDSTGYANYFVMPKERSSRERKIEEIYNFPPPHVMLQPLSSGGGTQDTNTAFITVLNIDKGSKRFKMRVELKRDIGNHGNDKYILYEKGHFLWL